MFLFYSNRRPEDAPFLDELLKVQKENANYKLIASITEMDKSTLQWAGETGYIDSAMLAKYLKGSHHRSTTSRDLQRWLARFTSC
jgi:ferredoxin-NADP reductase